MSIVALYKTPRNLFHVGTKMRWVCGEKMNDYISKIDDKSKIISIRWEDTINTTHYYNLPNIHLFIVFDKCKKLQAICDKKMYHRR